MSRLKNLRKIERDMDRELYNGSGMFGMAICPKCHEAEWKREQKRRKK